MSMTRGEAINFLQAQISDITGILSNPLGSEQLILALHRCIEVYDVAIASLRGHTREQIEKIFPGCALCNWGGLDYVGVDGDGIYLREPPADEEFSFCPVCGRPLTDEAVQMVMERMEAMNRENN